MIFAIAATARIAVALELGATALFRSPQLDTFELLEWARRVAHGDWRLPFYPTHGFPFPTLLGVWLFLCHGAVEGARICQALVGALNAALAGRLAFSLWRDARAGWTAGLLLALYGPLVLVDVALWEESLLVLALLAMLSALAAPPTRASAALAGLALGLAVAVRPTAIVLFPVGLHLIARGSAADSGARRRRVAFAAAALLVAGSAVTLASRATGAFLFVRGFGAINVWIGNDPASGGVQDARFGGAWDRLEAESMRIGLSDPGRLERHFLGKSIDRALADPAGFAGVLASKLVWLVQAEEPRDNHSYFFFRGQSRVLGLLPGFGLLLGLAAIGLAAPRPRGDGFRMVLLYLAAMALPVLAALMGLRYRLPMVIGWALLAALAPAAFAASPGRRRQFALAILGVAAFGFAHLRRHEATHRFGEEWTLTGNSWIKLGEFGRAEEAFRRADAEDPRSGGGPDGLGRLRQREGELTEAEALLREAVRRDPDSIHHHVHLAQLLVEAGRVDEGLAEFRAALAIDPTFQPVIERIGDVEASRGRLEEARAARMRLAELRPLDAEVWIEVARIDGATGRMAEGVAAAKRAVELAPRDRAARALLGFLAVEAGDLGTARESLAELARGAAQDTQQRLLAAALANAEGRWGEADRLLRELLEEQPNLAPARVLLLRNAARAGATAEAEEFLRALAARGR